MRKQQEPDLNVDVTCECEQSPNVISAVSYISCLIFYDFFKNQHFISPLARFHPQPENNHLFLHQVGLS